MYIITPIYHLAFHNIFENCNYFIQMPLAQIKYEKWMNELKNIYHIKIQTFNLTSAEVPTSAPKKTSRIIIYKLFNSFNSKIHLLLN